MKGYRICYLPDISNEPFYIEDSIDLTKQQISNLLASCIVNTNDGFYWQNTEGLNLETYIKLQEFINKNNI